MARTHKFSLKYSLPLALATLFAAPVSAAPQYQVTARTKLSGDQRWDYLIVDAEAKRLYITRDTSVTVFDLATKKELGTGVPTSGAHGVALAKKISRGFASSGRGNEVVVFDLLTLKVLGRIPTGKKPPSTAPADRGSDPRLWRSDRASGRPHEAA